MDNFSASVAKSLHFGDLGKGLFTDTNLFDIPSGGCAACNNVLWLDGYLRARPGLSEVFPSAPSSDPVCHLDYYTNYQGISKLMRVSRPSPTTLAVWAYSGGSWGLVASGLLGDSSVPITSANFHGKWYMTTGVGPMYRYDGTSFVTVASLQSTARFKVFDAPRIVVAGDSRLFVADCYTSQDGSKTDRVPYRVAWSDTLNGESWGGGTGGGTSGFVDFAQDSTPITGLYYSNSSLMVFKPTSIYIGYVAVPPKTYDFRQFVSGVGCVSHQSIRSFKEGTIVWLGDDDIYLGGPNNSPQAAGSSVRPRIRAIVDLLSIEDAVAVLDRQNFFYHLFLPNLSDSTLKKLFSLNMRNGSWWEGEFSSFQVGCATEYRQGAWYPQYLLGGNNGKIAEFSMSNLTDLGQNFNCNWTSGMAAVRKLTGNKTEQAFLDHIRVQALSSGADRVTLGAITGDGMDRLESISFGEQVLDGASSVMTSSRTYCREHFQIQVTGVSASFPKIAEIGVVFNLKGATRR